MSDEKKNLTVLATLYNNVSMEIIRYRDYEWKITAYIGGLFVWVISMVSNDKLVGAGSGFFIKLFWVSLILAIYTFALVSLYYVHKRLNSMRNRRTKIEHILSIHEPKHYLPDNFSIPNGWDKTDFDRIYEESREQKIKGFSEGKGVFFIISFMIFPSILALYAIIIICKK